MPPWPIWARASPRRRESRRGLPPVLPNRAFGVAESTGQGKVQAIRQMLRIHLFDHRWTLASRWESTLMIWTLTDRNGFMIDIRQQSVAMQRAAFRQGLIP